MKLGKTLSIVGLAILVSVGANATMIKSHDVVIKVETSGLDLNSERGQEILYRRLQSAAKEICGSTNIAITGSVARTLENRACYKETLSDAVESVGLPEFKALHQQSS